MLVPLPAAPYSGDIDVKLRNTLIGIPTENVWLDGLLSHAPDVRALAVILQSGTTESAHASEAEIARILQEHGFATLSLNLLTHYEQERDPDARFNVPQLANRVLAAAEWIGHQPPLTPFAIGLIASDTPCAAAIRAAVKAPQRFGAIVCHGGRPDLAGAGQLRALGAPVRFVVDHDDPHAAMLHQAYELIGGRRDWQTVAGTQATAASARLAAEWLDQQLPPPAAATEMSAVAVAPTGPPLPDAGPA